MLFLWRSTVSVWCPVRLSSSIISGRRRFKIWLCFFLSNITVRSFSHSSYRQCFPQFSLYHRYNPVCHWSWVLLISVDLSLAKFYRWVHDAAYSWAVWLTSIGYLIDFKDCHSNNNCNNMIQLFVWERKNGKFDLSLIFYVLKITCKIEIKALTYVLNRLLVVWCTKLGIRRL